jgi:colanic acid biosynthesis glycosyl transferase WcaI
MRILLLNQCFHPDVVSTAQHLTDLALGLAEQGHSVTVVASRRGYDDPKTRFPKRETWSAAAAPREDNKGAAAGITIIRIPSLGLGKKSKWRRMLDFASYWFCCVLRLIVLPRQDVVVALTSPPLISFLGAAFARAKGARFVFWTMDLNPDEAIAAGWLRERSLIARALDAMLRYSLRHADRIVALDRFMKERIARKGVPGEKIAVIPPWSHDDSIGFDEPGRRRFRDRHGLSGKFVVMYSGNHSPCHPLDTLLDAAHRLADHPGIAFCFVGGGKEFAKVQRFATERHMKNVVCLPYQPLNELSASLSAADLHAVVLGDPFVGIVHPCKIYNILRIGAPFVAISPAESHLTDLFSAGDLEEQGTAFCHGEVDALADFLEESAATAEWRTERQVARVASRFSKSTLLPGMLDLLVPNEPAAQPDGKEGAAATQTQVARELVPTAAR